MSWVRKLFGRNYIPEGRLTGSDIDEISQRWIAIEAQVQTGKPSAVKLAILDADKLVDQALKALYPTQPAMVERLKLAKDKFSSYQDYQDLWYAHKVRNLIAHESNYDLPTVEAVAVLAKYRKSLQQLGAL